MNTVLVVLPIDPYTLRLVRSAPVLEAAVNQIGGIKSLAEYCLHCSGDWDEFRYGSLEMLYYNLEVMDQDPREEKFKRDQILGLLNSQHFLLFLQNFFDIHKDLYARLLGQRAMEIYTDLEPVATKSEDEIALILAR